MFKVPLFYFKIGGELIGIVEWKRKRKIPTSYGVQSVRNIRSTIWKSGRRVKGEKLLRFIPVIDVVRIPGNQLHQGSMDLLWSWFWLSCIIWLLLSGLILGRAYLRFCLFKYACWELPVTWSGWHGKTRSIGENSISGERDSIRNWSMLAVSKNKKRRKHFISAYPLQTP